ncbi:RNA polymerase sigma factor [Olivibacter sp. XZL3]|uniref:RNA polymerase sigma factor n=1 Tax=Olivibacter sp. XZL3 TaxID=1735116 RepID=UPI0010653BF9|nr:sigma-70 family RNA polymerase sigma factor [Olivibacter sp. XZL3]
MMTAASFFSDTDGKTKPAIDDLQAFNECYYKYHHLVYANILKIVKQPAYAEDLLQDVFVSLWESRNKLSDKSIAGWLFVVSHNKAMDCLKRSLKLSVEYVDDYSLFEDLALEEEQDEAAYLSQVMMMKEAVNALPKRKKEVFRLCRFEGKSKEEVAFLLGISPGSVADYLKQSNKAIRDYILTHYPYSISGGLLCAIVFT